MTRICCTLFLVAACAGLVAARPETRPAKDKETFSDAHFAKKATACGLGEVNLGNLAARRATNPDVKKFAARTVKDHTKANRELLALANEEKIDVATTMSADDKKLMDRLVKLSGAEFDRAYMEGEIKDHEEAISLFEKEAKNGKNAKLRDWAKKTLPTIREHLKMAKDIQKALGSGKSGAGAPGARREGSR
jgi:putative membrane protein